MKYLWIFIVGIVFLVFIYTHAPLIHPALPTALSPTITPTPSEHLVLNEVKNIDSELLSRATGYEKAYLDRHFGDSFNYFAPDDQKLITRTLYDSELQGDVKITIYKAEITHVEQNGPKAFVTIKNTANTGVWETVDTYEYINNTWYKRMTDDDKEEVDEFNTGNAARQKEEATPSQ